MVCTLLDHRNEVKMFKTFQWNHSPAACGFTWVLNILTLFLWSILEYRGIENSWHFELLITSSHTVHTMNVNQLVESISHLQAWLDTNLLINPRTYMQILHTPHRGTSRGGGGVLKEPLRRVFDMLRYFKLILSSVHSLWSTNSLKKMRYILWVMALLEACDVTNNGRNLGCDLGFYQELEIRWKPRSMEILVCWTCKKHINKHHFIHKLYFYCWKKLKKHGFSLKNGLNTCYLWRHIS